MKKLLFIATTFLAVFSVASCDYYDKIENVSAGMFYESFWSSRPKGTSEEPYYTMKFSGTCHCRLRYYLKESVDVDLKAYYSCNGAEEDGHYYYITDFKKDYAHFKVLNDSILTLWVNGEAYTMYKQKK